MVDAIADGRLIVGLGAGWRKREFEAFGIPTKERAGLTENLVLTCRQAWGPQQATDPISSITPKPPRPIPFMLGGTAPAPIARAGRLGDGYIGTPQNDLPKFRAAVAAFDAAASEAGRDPHSLSLGLHVNVWVSEDGEIPPLVIDAMWHQIASYMRWHAEDDVDQEPGQELPALDMARLLARTISGTPGSVVEQVRPWVEEFADREFHMIFRLHYPGMRLADAEPALRLFAGTVLPELRRLTPP